MHKKIKGFGILLILVFCLTACSTNMEDLQRQIDELKEKESKQSEQISELENLNALLADRVIELENLQRQVNELKEKGNQQSGKISELENEIALINDRIKGLERTLLLYINYGFLAVETKDMIEFPISHYGGPMGFWAGYPIWMKHSDENAVFECVVDRSSFFLREGELIFSKNAMVKPGGFIEWEIWDRAEGAKIFDIEQAFVDIILKINNSIIGFAVVEIYLSTYPNTERLTYTARNLISVLLPKLDGEYQNTTEERIKAAIEEIKR